jgi:virginiamycin A acetyltransferase
MEMSPDLPSPDRDLRRSFLGGALLALSAISRFRRRALRLAYALEGGPIYSRTAREIMRRRFGVEIGAYSYGECFEPDAFPAGVVVGRYVSIGPGVLVFRRNHPIERLSTHPFFYNFKLGLVPRDTISSRPLAIGDDSWIGARAIITPGCSRIGLGSVVAAGAVVTRDVPDFAVVGGVPARLMKMRFPSETCERIRLSRWWTLPIDRCRVHLDQMTIPLDHSQSLDFFRGRD